jgi:hypothetical protein
MASVDRLARTVIMAAYAYYVLDEPFCSDAAYDKAVDKVCRRWDELHPDRKWAFGSPEELRTTGYHIKFSYYAVSAVYRCFNPKPRKPFPKDDEWFVEDGRRYVTTAGGFDPAELRGLL